MFRLLVSMMLRPLRAEPVRTALTVLAVALGVALVVAIDLASDAAAGSFRSSLETLQGDASLEIAATGGLDEAVLGTLVELPYPLEFRPRLDGFARLEGRGVPVPLIGLDLVSDGVMASAGEAAWEATAGQGRAPLFVSRSLGIPQGGTVRLTVNDRSSEWLIRGVVDGRDHFVVMDIGDAQRALGRVGRIDRIEVKLPRTDASRDWAALLRAKVPGADVRAYGAATDGNRRMLAAFRWNLRVLSYISLVVGAFLIYNTIAMSVVRRRAEIGILRAIGTTRAQVITLFLSEAAAFALAGACVGIPLGRLMAEWAVGLLATTVSELYVSSAPGDIALTAASVTQAAVAAFAMAILSALRPAREAAQVAPVEAMARGRRESHARASSGRSLAAAAVLALAAALAASREAVGGKPLFGYLACFLLIAAGALCIPALTRLICTALAGVARRAFGAEGLLAARSLSASLGRTSVLVAALSTAIAMMIAVGIMVGSFRQTVTLWMEAQLRADLYIRPAAVGGAGRFPTLAGDSAAILEQLPEVAAVDRFRLYEIEYGGLPALLGGGQTEVISRYGRLALMDEAKRDEVARRLPQGDYCIVSEPFANKHGVATGDRIALRLGGRDARFEVLGVYYDYSNERGYVIVDRSTLLRYLPDPALSSMAVYLKPGVAMADGRAAVERALDGRSVLVATNRVLREAAIAVFDRTFAITWALEAIATFVAMLGVTSALMALVIDRRRELGLLRFLGASASQIRRLLLCEAGILGLVASTAGVALGAVLSLILIRVINRQSFGWSIQFHWPTLLLAGALAAIYVATVAASLWPARAAVRMNPIEVIHEE